MVSNSIVVIMITNDYLKITLEVGDDNVAAKKLYSSLDYEDYRVVLKGQQHWQKYLN